MDLKLVSPGASEQALGRLNEEFRHARQWLDLKMRGGTYSLAFALELAIHSASRCYDVHQIYDEIGILEGADLRRSNTKEAKEFLHAPLKGFWHKHFMQASFMAENMFQEMNKRGAIEKALSPFMGQFVDDVAGQIAHVMTIDAYVKRASSGRLTGEWIVFEKDGDKNNYLTLANHKEDNAVIRARIDANKTFDIKVKQALP